MRRLDIRFKKETNQKQAASQLEMLDKLSRRLPKRIQEKYEDVDVRIRLSSATGYEVSGFKGDEKEKFLIFLEEIWNDDSLLE